MPSDRDSSRASLGEEEDCDHQLLLVVKLLEKHRNQLDVEAGISVGSEEPLLVPENEPENRGRSAQELTETSEERIDNNITAKKTPKMKSLLVILGLAVSLTATVILAHPTSDKDSNLSDSSDSILPPDTFRKLAQALYQRGDGEDDLGLNRLERKFFNNKSVTCNDGSTAGYYLRRNYQSKRWIIFLEGGWICHDEQSCHQRASREHRRVSSDRWPSVHTVEGGILSANPRLNPHYSEANHVFVPYCSSDSWSGTRPSEDPSSRPAFMGHLIVREVIKELAEYQQLLYAEELLLTGSSAGGTGVLVNVDPVAEMVAGAGVKVRGVVDSGWFLDNDPFSSECKEGRVDGDCSVIADLKRGVKLWGAKVPRACEESFPGNQVWKCFFGYKIFPLLKSPLFIFQWQFDNFQLYANNVNMPPNLKEWNFIHELGTKLKHTLNGVTESEESFSAVFSPACIAHEVLTKAVFKDIAVNGVTLADALFCWAQSLPDSKPIFQTGEFSDLEIRSQISEKFLEKDEDAAKETRFHSHAASMLADAPHQNQNYFLSGGGNRGYKLASNLVRSMPTSRENARNSINGQWMTGKRRRNRHRHGNRNISNRTGNTDREKRRRNRKCRNNPEDCDVEMKASKNRNLVRSLDRRSNRVKDKKEKKENRNKNSKDLTEEERALRKERRKRRKERRREKRRKQKLREKRKKRKQRKRERRRLKRLRERRQQRSFNPSSSGHKKRTLKVRSVSQPQRSRRGRQLSSTCKRHHVDSCTFPHCNPTCPALLNPETGHEVDFLSLLESFGLEIGNVARALNLDIATLQGMDRGDLAILLTSSTPTQL